MVIVVAAEHADAALAQLTEAGEAAFRVGQLVPATGEAEVILQGHLAL